MSDNKSGLHFLSLIRLWEGCGFFRLLLKQGNDMGGGLPLSLRQFVAEFAAQGVAFRTPFPNTYKTCKYWSQGRSVERPTESGVGRGVCACMGVLRSLPWVLFAEVSWLGPGRRECGGRASKLCSAFPNYFPWFNLNRQMKWKILGKTYKEIKSPVPWGLHIIWVIEETGLRWGEGGGQ